MASPPPRTRTRHSADVALRHLAPGGRARVHWAAPAEPSRAALVVLFSPDDELVDHLVERLGAVVMTVPAVHAIEGHAAVSWAADHAAELGADAARLAVVGDRAGAALAERVGRLAAEEGWPPLRHVASIWPHHDATAALDGLARALADAGPRPGTGAP